MPELLDAHVEVSVLLFREQLDSGRERKCSFALSPVWLTHCVRRDLHLEQTDLAEWEMPPGDSAKVAKAMADAVIGEGMAAGRVWSPRIALASDSLKR